MIIRVAATVAARDRRALTAALDEAAGLAVEQTETTRAVDEVLLQCTLFTGYPAALDALAEWRARAAPSVSTPTVESLELWADRGARVCGSVYGDQYEPLRENIRALHPDADEWMVTQGYGRVLGRPGLDIITRELAIVVQLAIMGATRQLYSHARGAMRVGASAADVEGALEAASPWIPESQRSAIDEVWDQVRSRPSPSPSQE